MRFNALLLSLLLPFFACALPAGAKGAARIETPDVAHMEVRTEALRVAIEWNSFSIAEGESVHFFCPSSDSAVLNNVTGGSISHLMGELSSNGSIYIVNPNGMIIGKDAVVNVAALVASTLSITNEDFFKGRDRFAGHGGTVTNLGTIQASCGDVHLIGHSVENSGVIQAADRATLTSAGEAWLQPNGNKKVLIRRPVDGKISNSGLIEAVQTELLADGNLFRLAINHTGEIRAPKLTEEGGRVFLRAEGGEIHVMGQIEAPGGHVEVLGDQVIADKEARIDVSREGQAGTINFGGDWRGLKVPFRSRNTYVGPKVQLLADGLDIGNGGTIVVWGTDHAQITGCASSRGGLLGGDGGWIEISQMPYIEGSTLSAFAPVGKSGGLLLDPPDITITTAATSAGVTQQDGTYSFSGATSPLNISASEIEGLLHGGTDVVIEATAGSSTAAATGNITLGVQNASDAIIDVNGQRNLYLIAAPEGSIYFYQGVKNSVTTSTGNLLFKAKNIEFGSESERTTSDIRVLAGGSLFMELSADSGRIALWGGAGSVTVSALNNGSAETGLIIQEADGVSGGQIHIEARGTGDAILNTLDTLGSDISINFNAMSSVPDQHNSITLYTSPLAFRSSGQALLDSSKGLQVDVPGDVAVIGVVTSSTIVVSGLVAGSTSTIACRSLLLQAEQDALAKIMTRSSRSGTLTIDASKEVVLQSLGGEASIIVPVIEIVNAPHQISVTTSGIAVAKPALIEADEHLSIVAKAGGSIGDVTVTGGGVADSIASLIGGDITISTAGWLSLTNTTTSDAKIASNASGGEISITATEGIELNAQGAGAVTMGTGSGGSIELASAGSCTVKASQIQGGSAVVVSAESIIASRGGEIITKATSGSPTISLATTAGDLLLASASDASFSIGPDSGATQPALSLTSSGGDLVLNNGSSDPSDLKIEGSSITMTTDGSVYIEGALLDAQTGDIKVIANVNAIFQEAATLNAEQVSGQKIVIATNQAPGRTNIGHVETSSATTFTTLSDAASRLMIFCGYFENNRISPGTEFNGEQYVGSLDVPDVHNVYEVNYATTPLPAKYGLPYTFYYEQTTPLDEIIRQIYIGWTLVSSTTVSTDAALTEFYEQDRRIFSREKKKTTTPAEQREED